MTPGWIIAIRGPYYIISHSIRDCNNKVRYI
jgi:hypothetical protein